MNLMTKLESGKKIDGENFEDVVRYDNQVINDTVVKNSNVGSPIFFGCNLKNISFENCDLNNSRFFSGCIIDSCQFTRSDLRATGIEKGEAFFKDCEFNACDMRGMTLESVNFINCKLIKCKFNGRVLNVMDIQNCTFSGKLVDITFQGEGKSSLNANLEDCILEGVVFNNCDLSACIPPKQKDHIYIKDLSSKIKNATRLVDANKSLAEDDKKSLLRFFKRLGTMEQYIFNVAHIRKTYGDGFFRLLSSFLNLVS